MIITVSQVKVPFLIFKNLKISTLPLKKQGIYTQQMYNLASKFRKSGSQILRLCNTIHTKGATNLCTLKI